ncbi:MAG: aminoacetone oxidase family FAD-binding enzyme, partial [Saprospiraceae bacterium]
PFMWNALARHGYDIVPPVPSLFTFNLPNHPICKLMGLVVNDVQVTIQDSKIVTTGPILVTHWGLSAPAVLKASAWGATLLNERNYNFNVMVDWIPTVSQDQILHMRDDMAKKKVISNQLFGLPARLWQFLMSEALTTEEKNWASLTKNEMSMIIRQLKKCVFPVKGKTTFKEEFVTAGGIALHQINFKSFESKLHPGLFMAGEVLNIDAVTGGFNFQAAWTGGYIAGSKMAEI